MTLLRHSLRLTMFGLAAALLSACGPQETVDLSAPTEPMAFAQSETTATAAAAPVVQGKTRGKKPAAVNPDALSDRYYIEFRARSAQSYGHTFAAIGQLKANGEIGTMEIAGLHPATESSIPWMIGHILPVPSETGASDGDTEDQYIIARYRVTMDKARFDRLMGFVRNLQKNSPAWHAVLYNCNAFVGDIAKHMGLTPPDNTLHFPQEYIERLAGLNRGVTQAD